MAEENTNKPDRAARTHQEITDPDLVSIPKVGPILGKSSETLYRWARAGTFPGDAAIKLGGNSWVVSLPKLRRHLHGEVGERS